MNRSQHQSSHEDNYREQDEHHPPVHAQANHRVYASTPPPVWPQTSPRTTSATAADGSTPPARSRFIWRGIALGG
ncbi:hypothetical protein NUW54_g7477 [Trametes sanguinea]|uniref:Uncharacterized protein n=1 Tax=Trametes sanguinea TaxID=158606 RepID=A0ACC1PM28_9APHY|nr:hypothetical protein NUW54_g7477 [Trametes sanguinea]